MANQISPLMISYAREDQQFALRLAKTLREAEKAVWIDQLDIRPGQRWDTAIESALKECAGVMVILSPASVTSQNVMDEVSYALEVGKKVVPILHLPCDIPFRLRRVQYIDFTADYETSIGNLIAALENTGSLAAQSINPIPPTSKGGRPKTAIGSKLAVHDASASTSFTWQRRVVGSVGGVLFGALTGAVMVDIRWGDYGKGNVNWRTFDYGNPVVFMMIALGIAGAITGTDVGAILYAVVGLGVGFLLFTFLNSALFIVEEGIVLLALGALIGAIIGRIKAVARTRAEATSR